MAEKERSYYDILGVSEDAKTKEIEEAFEATRAQCKTASTAMFLEIYRAYGTLKDKNKRKEYDEKRNRQVPGDRRTWRDVLKELKRIFTAWFDWLVKTIENLFGFFDDNNTGSMGSFVRQTLLVAAIPFLVAIVRFVNWVYLYVLYHIGYNVPVSLLTLNNSLLVSFGFGAIAVAGIILFLLVGAFLVVEVYERPIITIIKGILVVLVFGILLTVFFRSLLTAFLVIILLFLSSLFAVEVVADQFIAKRQSVIYDRKWIVLGLVIAVISFFLILLFYTFPIKIFSAGEQTEKLQALYIIGMLSVCLILPCLKQKDKLKIFILWLVAVFMSCYVAFYYIEMYQAESPYAIVSDSQMEDIVEDNAETIYVVAYQGADLSVLEEARIDESMQILTIDTSKQQIVKNETLTYEYQSFDTVIIE